MAAAHSHSLNSSAIHIREPFELTLAALSFAFKRGNATAPVGSQHLAGTTQLEPLVSCKRHLYNNHRD
ncbi:hypothetical protein OH492_20540 [Vibrio chagasii]|nr:hypothetical protein [Vibrio chagasii]